MSLTLSEDVGSHRKLQYCAAMGVTSRLSHVLAPFTQFLRTSIPGHFQVGHALVAAAPFN
jgi:hypothetical protein